MVISRKTLINDLLRTDRDAVIKQLIQLNASFSKLRNPLIRNLFAKMVDIEAACKVAGCEVSAFLQAMSEIGFTIDENVEVPSPPTEPAKEIKGSSIRILDVRPVLARQEDPIKLILKNIDELQEDECLKLIAPFEPVPLIHMLNAKGYIHQVEQEEGSVVTYFKKDDKNPAQVHKPRATSTSQTPEADFEALLETYKGNMQTLDVRNLEMPQPMIKILENLQALKEGQALFVYHKKLPVYLLPHLQERGFVYSTQATADGKINLIIYKP